MEKSLASAEDLAARRDSDMNAYFSRLDRAEAQEEILRDSLASADLCTALESEIEKPTFEPLQT